MNSRTAGHSLPEIGDILLLVSKNKLRKPNTAYQTVVRRKTAAYSHVAIVCSTYSIIDATPTDGVAIRLWDVISKQYDIERSMVVRHRRLASSPEKQEHLIRRILYYYAQPYSLMSLLSKKREFRDREGLVCSQFVAIVFEETGIPSSSISPRETLPIDIEVHTRRVMDWSRFALSNYQLGSSSTHADSITAKLHNSLSSLDEYFAKFIIKIITISKASLLLNVFAQMALTELESGRMTDEDMAKLLCMSDRGDFRISADEFILFWRRLFVEPEHPPQFLHEESFDQGDLQKGFVRSCEKLLTYVEATSPQQDKLIYEGMNRVQTICTLISERINGGIDYAEVFGALIMVRQYLSQAIELKDNVFANVEQEDIAKRIKGYPVLMMELQNNPRADLDNAFQCLKAIGLFDEAHKQWIDLRQIVLRCLQQVDSLIAMANSNETPSPS